MAGSSPPSVRAVRIAVVVSGRPRRLRGRVDALGAVGRRHDLSAVLGGAPQHHAPYRLEQALLDVGRPVLDEQQAPGVPRDGESECQDSQPSGAERRRVGVPPRRSPDVDSQRGAAARYRDVLHCLEPGLDLAQEFDGPVARPRPFRLGPPMREHGRRCWWAPRARDRQRGPGAWRRRRGASGGPACSRCALRVGALDAGGGRLVGWSDEPEARRALDGDAVARLHDPGCGPAGARPPLVGRVPLESPQEPERLPAAVAAAFRHVEALAAASGPPPGRELDVVREVGVPAPAAVVPRVAGQLVPAEPHGHGSNGWERSVCPVADRPKGLGDQVPVLELDGLGS